MVFCLDRAGLVGEDGATHHGTFDLAYLRTIPGMTVCAPRDATSLRRLMYTALDCPGPIAIRYPRGAAADHPSDTRAPLPTGRGECLRAGGKDGVILTIGPVATQALEAAARAERELGVDIAVYDMIFLKPLAESNIHTVVTRGAPVITVEDGTVDGGLGSAVTDILASRGVNIPVTRLGIPDRFIPQGTPAQLYRLCGYDAEGIFTAITQLKQSAQQ